MPLQLSLSYQQKFDVLKNVLKIYYSVLKCLTHENERSYSLL